MDTFSSQTYASDIALEVVPAGVRDLPTVAAGGVRLSRLEGVVSTAAVVQADHRGTLMETVNFDSPFWEEPVVYAYTFTVAPGRIKGWGMHRRQTDRYAVLAGRLRVVLYDGRPARRPTSASPSSASPTRHPASCESRPASGTATRTSARPRAG